MSIKITDGQLIAAYNDIKRSPKLSDVAVCLGISEKSVRNRIGRLRKDPNLFIISRANVSEKDYIDKDDILVPIIPDMHFLERVTTTVDGEGNIKLQHIKTAFDREQKKLRMQILLEEMKQYVHPSEPLPEKEITYDKDLLSFYPVGDSHAGLYSWMEETGSHFDLEEFERIQKKAIDELVKSTPNSEIAIFNPKGDESHADNGKNRTPRSGHELDVHGRHSQVIRVLIKVRFYQISRLLEKHKKVIVRIDPGNHDIESALMVALILEAYYNNEPRVEVITSPNPYWFYNFGKNMFCTAHGDGAKGTSMGAIMANDEPLMWGNTEHRVCFLGHVHHKDIKEHIGVDVEYVNTIAAPDYYSHHKGYRSKRRIYAVTYHRLHGEEHRVTVNMSRLEFGKK